MKRRALLLQQAALWAWTAAAATLLGGLAPEALTLSSLGWFLAGHLLGDIVCWFGHPHRRLGWIPLGWAGLSVYAFLVGDAANADRWLFAFGACSGLVDVPLSYVFEQLPLREWRGFFRRLLAVKATSTLGGWALAVVLSAAAPSTGSWEGSARTGLWFAGLAAAGMAAYSLGTRAREVIELTAAFVLWPAYRIRCRRPGARYFPLYGPVIVIANHAAFFDPCWIGKVVPRRIIPMMTSVFYDVPILHWLMKRVIRAIRVQESSYRYEVPELKEALARLDDGECLVIFPEGNLRREDSKLLRRFGQGIWHILRERPLTPVVPCWIDGNWGSFFSHWHGPPMKNKPPDFWRRITVLMAPPLLVPPAVLEEHQQTRQYLMDAVAELQKALSR
jgi:1-acyl-sn-glycerol-3-phosphate acyltransferase